MAHKSDSQADKGAVGAGHPATPQVLPGQPATAANTPATASVSGQQPVIKNYPHN